MDTDGNVVTDNTNVQANRADWKIRVNDQLGVHELATVSDTLNEGHVLDATSVKIYRVNRNKLTGEQIGERVDVTSDFNANSEDSGFSIEFGSIDDTYEIEYTTIIDQVNPGSENTIIDNLAEITYDGTLREYEDDFELEWPMGSESIIKNGTVDPNDPSKILWTVYYNYEKDNLGNVTFVDDLSLGEVDPTTLEVYEVVNPQPGNLDPWAGGATLVNPKPVANVNGTNMTFSIPESNGKAYYITFESTVPGGLVDQDVTNTIDDENPNTPPAEDTVIVTTPLGGATKEGIVGYEDGEPYILWTVTFNENKVAYDSFAFSDSFDTSLLTLDMDSFVLAPDTEFTVNPSEDGFNFNLNGTSEREVYSLTYKTTYTEAGLKAAEVTNALDLDWDGEGVGPSKKVGHPAAGINKRAAYVTGKDSDGKARQEIEWLVAFNTNNLVLESPVLSDRFSPAELEIVPGSFEFYTGEGAVLGTSYTYSDVAADAETNTKGFDIEFHGNTEPTPYYVKYRTTLPAGNTGANNAASLAWQGNSEKDNANAPIGVNEPGASKGGAVEIAEDGLSKKINWEIIFNQNKRIIQDLVITDTYTPTDAALVDEIAIHKADGTPLVPGADGDYVISEEFGSGGFTIEFNDQTEPVEYTLTYSTEYNEYSDNINAFNKAEVSFLGGKNTRETTITPVELNVEKQSTGVDTSSNPAVISWAITSNTNLKTLKDAILVDTIEDDQLYVEGSMELDGVKVTPEWNETEFTVALPDGANSHTLTYQTQIIKYPSNYGTNNDEYYNKVDLINYSSINDEGEEDPARESVADDAIASYYQEGKNNNPGKSGEQDPETDLIVWTATVNPDAHPIKNASIRDVLDINQVYFTLEDGSLDLTVERVTGDNTEVVPSSEYTVALSEVDGVPQFVLTFNDSDSEIANEINHTYKLTYSTSLRDDIVGQREVGNMIQIVGYDSETIIEEIQTSTTSAKWYFGGSGSSQSLNLKVVKIDADDNNIPLQNVEFQLQDGRGGQPRTFTTDENGEIDVAGLRVGRHTLTETKPLPGYQGMAPIHFYLSYGENKSTIIDLTNSSWATDNLERLESAEIPLVNEKIKVPVTATKEWQGGPENNRPTIYFQLYRQVGENEAEPVSDAEIKALAQGTTSVTWENEVAFDDAGNEYTFSVKEVNAEGKDFTPTGYTKVENGLTVTNTETPIEVSVLKDWVDGDNQDGIRPESVEVQLQADTEAYGESVILNAENEWTHEWAGLSAYNDQGELIVYSVIELDLPEGYESNVTMNEAGNLVLTNTHIPAVTELTVNKEWEDGTNQDGLRPESIEVQLMAGEDAIGDPVVLDVASGWTHTWTELPTNESGQSIEYSVNELNVPEGYDATISENIDGVITITNTHTPAVVNIPVSKEWNDAENQDDIRPETITANLLADGNPAGNIELSDDNEWTHIFENLPVYNNGSIINYTVTEDTVEDYSTNIEGTVAEGFVITNSYTPDETSVTVTKNWQDGNNQDGNRLESIEVQLTADGANTEHTAVLTEENNWTATWSGLALNSDGTAIDYSVEEITEVDGYEVVVDDTDHGNIILTNSYEPEVTDLTVNKVWDDAENQDGIQPELVEIQLIANNQEQGEPVTLTADNNWTYSWTDLAVNAAGEAIEYSIVEVNVPEGYTSTASEIVDGTITVTNEYTPEVTNVSITKEWDDEDNLAGFRPDHIEVELYADGVETGKIINIVADEEGAWKGSFINLPKYRDEGTQIDYTVKEVSLDENLYSVEVIPNEEDVYDFTLINTHVIERIELNGTKTWNDAENQDGVRPESITVNLLANGIKVADIEVTAATDWTFEFTGLPKFENGEEINYTIQEDKVEEYSTEIDGMDITNSYTPGQTSINVVKAWDDVQDQDGIRPESITVKLFANGKDTGQELVLSDETNWQGDFTELDEYSNGELIVYTIEEIAVEGYDSTITGTSEDGFVITNTHKPAEPEEPVDPESPEKPGEEKPGDTDSEDPKDSDKGSDLPSTGEAASYTLLALVLVGLGFGLRYYGKRRIDK